MGKKDVMAFVQRSFDDVIDKVSKLTPAQLSKTHASKEGNLTGLELLMACSITLPTIVHRQKCTSGRRASRRLSTNSERTQDSGEAEHWFRAPDVRDNFSIAGYLDRIAVLEKTGVVTGVDLCGPSLSRPIQVYRPYRATSTSCRP